MRFRKMALVLLTVLAAGALVGAANAQSGQPNDPPPTPQYWQDHQGQTGTNNSNDPNHDWWHNNNGQGQQGNDHHHPWDNNFHFNRNQYIPPRNNYNPYYYYTPNTYATPVPYVDTTAPTDTTLLNEIVTIVAQQLDQQPSAITAQLASMSLSKIITADGGNVDAITGQVVLGVTTWLNTNVSQGAFTQARADQILSNLGSIVMRALNGDFTQTNGVVSGLETTY